VLFLSLPVASAQTDEEAIVQLLEAETAYFLDHSMAEVVQQFWVLDEHTRMNIFNGTNLIVLTLDKEDMLAMTEKPPASHATIQKSNHKVYVNGNMGFESHDQLATMQDGYRQISHELRILERVNGVWKIHVSTVQIFSPW
jgi:hypothetical protein